MMAHTLLVGIAVAFGVSLVAAWVAALSAPEQTAEPSSLDAWDNGRAHFVGANCCGAEAVSKVGDWTLCAEHDLAA
jgi:hypothetical protein